MKTALNTLLLLIIVSGSAWGQFQKNVEVAGKNYHDVCIEPLSYNSPSVTEFIVAGNLFDPAQGTDIAFLKKVNENGNVIWNNTYENDILQNFRILDIVNYEDLIIATGYIEEADIRKVFLAKFNAVNGSFIQAESYNVGISIFDDFSSTGVHVSYTNSDADGDGALDPGFVVAGYSSICNTVDVTCLSNAGLVLRTDLSFNPIWTVDINSPIIGFSLDYDFANNVTETSDGFFITGSGNYPFNTNNVLQCVMAHKLDFQGNLLWDESYTFGNAVDLSVDAHYDVSTDKIYMLTNYSVSHTFGITVFDNNGTYDASRSWYAGDPNYMDTYGFTLMPALSDPNNLVISGYDREESWMDGTIALYGETQVFVTEFEKNTGNPVSSNYIYTVPNTNANTDEYSFWNSQMPLMYYPDMSFPKTDNNNNNHYYFAGYRLDASAIGNVNLELFKVDPSKFNACSSLPYEPIPYPLVKDSTNLISALTVAVATAFDIYSTTIDYADFSCSQPPLVLDTGAYCCDGANLVTNGNFENQVNLGFTSSYGLNSPPFPGEYEVTDANGALSAFNIAVTDHSYCDNSTLYAANDHFMVVNGKTQKNGNAVVWEQTISGLDMNSKYKFCANFYNMSQCTFDTLMRVKMKVVGQSNSVFNTISSGSGPCDWVNQSINFTTGTNTSVTLKIILWQKANGDGNDLAIDDISVSKVIDPDLNITVQHQGSNQEITASINSIDFNDDALHGTDCEYYWWVGEVPNYPFPTPSPPSLPFGFVSGNASPPHNWNLTTNFTPFYNFNPNTLYFIGMYTPECGCYDEGFTYQLTYNSLVPFEMSEEQKQLIIDTILSEANDNDVLENPAGPVGVSHQVND